LAQARRTLPARHPAGSPSRNAFAHAPGEAMSSMPAVGRAGRRPDRRVTVGSALLCAAGAAAVLSMAGGLTRPAFALAGARQSPAPRRGLSVRAAEQDAPTAEDGGGWKMMPLGVPKVAYRIPGAPNAEWVDIYNRLYRERIIFLGKEIDDRLANEIIGVLLYLDSEDNSKPIYLYINSAGGSVLSGLAIYDTLQHIKSPVITINVGLAASMASFLLASGEKGKRIALPHSRVMIHQAMGGAQGQAEDIKVEAMQILTIHENIIKMYSKMTGKSEDVIREDIMRDNFMSAEEAKAYGLIDQVIQIADMGDLPSRGAAATGEAPKGEVTTVAAEAKPAASESAPETKEV